MTQLLIITKPKLFRRCMNTSQEPLPKPSRHIIKDDASDTEDNVKPPIKNNTEHPTTTAQAEVTANIPDESGNHIIKQLRYIYDNLSPQGKQVTKHNIDLLENAGNDTEYKPFAKQEPLFVPPVINTEATMVNVMMKSFVSQIQELSQHLGKEITKSTELAHQWKQHIHALDKYIESLKQMPWKKVLTYGACLITVTGFLWKMGAARALPDFLSNVIQFVPKTVLPEATIPKPNIESTLRTAMETPVTPLTIITAVGAITVTLSILKVTLLVLRKLPK